MTYSELQQEQRAWSLSRFGEIPAEIQALKVLAEIGELAEAHLAGIYGKRGAQVDAAAMKRDAVGDIVIALAGYCNARGEGRDLAEELGTARNTWNVTPLRSWSASTDSIIVRMGEVPDVPRTLLQCLLAYCNHELINFDSAVFDTWAVVKRREWGGAA